MSELTQSTRAQIVLLKEEGYTEREIAARFSISKTAVHVTIVRYRKTGNYSSLPRSGRKRKTTSQTDRLIHRISKANPRASARFIKSCLPEEAPSVSVSTVKRRLQKDFGLRAYRICKKPKLSAKNIKDRLQFCRTYADWTEEQWSKVLFTDETLIKQFSSSVLTVRRPSGERYNSRYTLPTIRHCPSVMVWGGISSRGRGPIWLAPANSTVTGAVYLSILKEKLPTWLPLTGCTIIQQDGAPCHNSKMVKDWCRQNNFEILAKWPGNSPDLNVIENCWKTLKYRVAEMNPTSVDDLREKIKIAWTQYITPEYCATLVSSMPRRLRAVLQARGQHVKY